MIIISSSHIQDDQLGRSVQCDECSGAIVRSNATGLRISEMVGDTVAAAMWRHQQVRFHLRRAFALFPIHRGEQSLHNELQIHCS